MERNMFTYEAIDSALVIHLPKEVDHHNCLTLKYETDLLLAENYINRIIFDFSGTEFMDSSGIGVILNRYKQMEGSSGTGGVRGRRADAPDFADRRRVSFGAVVPDERGGTGWETLKER